MSIPIILGIDLSVTGLGLVAVPGDWDLDWRRIRRTTLGIKLSRGASAADHIRRRSALARDVVAWATHVRATHVWIEGYPASGRVFNLAMVAEIGGVARDHLATRLGLYAETAPQSTARKLFLGKLPREDKKAHVVQAIQALASPSWTPDECDAFVAANFGLSELGFPCAAGVLLPRAA
jgi:hypothetical protein